MTFYFTPWNIKEQPERLLVEIIDCSGAVVASEVEKPYAEFITEAVNEKGKRLEEVLQNANTSTDKDV